MPIMADITSPLPLPGGAAKVEQDFGFGQVVSSRHGYRLLNRDGSYNMRTEHGSMGRRFLSYYTFLSMSWPRFFGAFAIAYLATNALFALLYVAAGPGELEGTMHGSNYLRAYFFSVHTLATVGYGSIAPVGTLANIIVTAETLIGLALFALFTGLVFARFSRPVAGIVYSDDAIIAPYGDITAFEFRVVNSRCNPLFNLNAQVVLSRFEQDGSGRQRRYHTLKLERDSVAFFPLNWTVVHAIDRDSPFWRWTRQMLIDAEAEVFILITAFDDTYSQIVSSRASYTAHEIKFGRRFVMMYHQDDNQMVLDLGKLNTTEEAAMQA